MRIDAQLAPSQLPSLPSPHWRWRKQMPAIWAFLW